MVGRFLLALEDKFMLFGFSKYAAKMIVKDLKNNRINQEILLSNIRGLGWDVIFDKENSYITFIRYNDILRVNCKGDCIDWNTLRIVF